MGYSGSSSNAQENVLCCSRGICCAWRGEFLDINVFLSLTVMDLLFQLFINSMLSIKSPS